MNESPVDNPDALLVFRVKSLERDNERHEKDISGLRTSTHSLRESLQPLVTGHSDIIQRLEKQDAQIQPLVVGHAEIIKRLDFQDAAIKPLVVGHAEIIKRLDLQDQNIRPLIDLAPALEELAPSIRGFAGLSQLLRWTIGALVASGVLGAIVLAYCTHKLR